MKIIVYTGSFNPITNGHLHVMDAAMKQIQADQGLFVMVDGKYLIRKMYQKNNTTFVLPDDTRQEAIKLACLENENYSYGGKQIGGSNPSTIKTLNSIARKHKNSQIYLLMGADKLKNFSKWSDAEDIINSYYIIIAARQDINIDSIINNDKFLTKNKNKLIISYPDPEVMNISSSAVRNAMSSKTDYTNLVPHSVYNILRQVQLKESSEPTYEDKIYFELTCNGRFGSTNACKLVYKSNAEIFKNWDTNLLGNKNTKLHNTKVYKNKFKTNYNYNYNTIFDCVNQDCADVCLDLLQQQYNPCILNLASNVSPGGGYHNGTSAQEECLCQMSTLSQSLYQFGSLKYKHIREANLPNYPDVYPMDINYGGIYSPDVVFFRHNKSKYFKFREQVFASSIVTVASLSNIIKNSYTNDERVYFNHDGTFTSEGLEIETNKVRTILRIALDNGHDSIILGAFGCGVYNLLPSEVSQIFYNVLNEPEFKGNFKKVVFAILEGKGRKGKLTGKDGKFKPFYELFS